MRKLRNYVMLGLMGLIETLAIGVTSADDVTIIYHPEANVSYTLNGNENFTGGLITITDGDETYTIMDRNLGATKSGSTCSSSDLGACGYYFQWGNNYGFPSDPNASIATSTTQVNASGYGPGNYYSSSTFIKRSSSPYDRSSVQNDNLRGGVSGTYEAMQGPCPEGYHVPSSEEWLGLSTMLGYDGTYSSVASKQAANILRNELYFPFADSRSYSSAGVSSQGTHASYWSSTAYSANRAYRLLFSSAGLNPQNGYSRSYGFSVRCFKNSPYSTSNLLVSFWDEDVTSQIWSGEVESGTILADSGTVTAILSGYENSKTGYSFNGWIISGTDTAIDLSDPITTGLELVASWTMDTYNLSIDLNRGTLEAGETNPTSYNVESEDITLKNPVREGYTFAGWTGTDLTTPEVAVIITKGSTGDREYFANWTANEYSITFKDGSGTETDVVWTGNYGDTVTAAYPSWTKEGYTGSWDTTIPATVPAENTVITMIWTAKPRLTSGGGGSSLKKDNCPNGDYSDSYYDGTCGSKDSSSQAPQNDGERELQTAYERAYENGITTMDTIDKADMEGNLTRIAMAKMLSKYAINVLGKKPANTIVPNFSDITEELNAEYDYGVSLAYQLGIMGINMPNNKFRPFDNVTRAEFVTALSRMEYNTPDGEEKYYSTHMELLEKLGIITNTNPSMLELRGYVMLMLMRSTSK